MCEALFLNNKNERWQKEKKVSQRMKNYDAGTVLGRGGGGEGGGVRQKMTGWCGELWRWRRKQLQRE